MKCELCSREVSQVIRCQICDTRFCPDCGDYERSLCRDCIDFNDALDGDIGDLNES
ncbi:MAG: hypothetical protein WC307_00690 [Candidatus Nanoarchaeia archaeon]